MSLFIKLAFTMKSLQFFVITATDFMEVPITVQIVKQPFPINK